MKKPRITIKTHQVVKYTCPFECMCATKYLFVWMCYNSCITSTFYTNVKVVFIKALRGISVINHYPSTSTQKYKHSLIYPSHRETFASVYCKWDHKYFTQIPEPHSVTHLRIEHISHSHMSWDSGRILEQNSYKKYKNLYNFSSSKICRQY